MAYHHGATSGNEESPGHSDDTLARADPAISRVASRQNGEISIEVHVHDLACLERAIVFDAAVRLRKQ